LDQSCPVRTSWVVARRTADAAARLIGKDGGAWRRETRRAGERGIDRVEKGDQRGQRCPIRLRLPRRPAAADEIDRRQGICDSDLIPKGFCQEFHDRRSFRLT